MTRFFRWFIVNGVFVALLYAENILMLKQAGWVVNGFVGLFGVFSLLCLFVLNEEQKAEVAGKAPYSKTFATMDWIFNLTYFGALLWFGKFWIAGFYIPLMLWAAVVHEERKKLAE